MRDKRTTAKSKSSQLSFILNFCYFCVKTKVR
jgi:hypothetical protein